MGAAKPPELLLDARQRYRDAQSRAKLAAREWKKQGSPLTLTHANHVVGIHPLLRVVMDAERHTDRMREGIRSEERGSWRVPHVRPHDPGVLGELSPAAALRSISGGKK
jgi:hypothetical protein